MMSKDDTKMLALIMATRNAHKVEEIRAILGAQYTYLTLNDFPEAPQVVEDAHTFAGNATKKAVELARWLARIPSAREKLMRQETLVLADDSGLEVDALGGSPGVHSARFAALEEKPGEVKTAANSMDAANNAKLLRLLKDVPAERRTARFRCVLALTPMSGPTPDASSPTCYASESELRTELFDGVCEGRIGFAPRGTKGFGYDPLFMPIGYNQSFAELGEELKNGMSHRARALGKLRVWLNRAAAS